MNMRVGIVGISGFGGGEAMRLVASHPSFELVYAAGEGSAGSRLVDRFTGVPGRLADLVIEKWDASALPKLDVLFASLPTGTSADALARVPKDVKIVDIGGDHRYAEGWAYGLADVWPEQVKGRSRIANPGCFPAGTAVLAVDAGHELEGAAGEVEPEQGLAASEGDEDLAHDGRADEHEQTDNQFKLGLFHLRHSLADRGRRSRRDRSAGSTCRRAGRT